MLFLSPGRAIISLFAHKGQNYGFVNLVEIDIIYDEDKLLPDICFMQP